uniref:Uncharacterized protein n=1 Tax=Peronospora matthiolae TaxID=2874970 RepID=A0AAV1TNH1_9STRA
MIKRETRCSKEFEKLAEAKQYRDIYKNNPARCQVRTEMIDKGSKSVDREVKFQHWQFDYLIWEYYLKKLKKLLSRDPVLKTIKLKLTRSLRGPITVPTPTPNVSKGLQSPINPLKEVVFTEGTFNAQTILECNHDRVTATGKSLFKKVSPLLGIRDPGDNPTPPIGTSDQRITPRITTDQVLTPINDFPKGKHIGSS